MVAAPAKRLSVLVTGGAGYIGRFCVRQLLESGHDITVLDRRAMLSDGPFERVHSMVGDIADGPLVDSLLAGRGIDTVLHLAAEKSVDESMAAPGRHLINNVAGSLALLEAMRARAVRRIVFSSSAAVYGTPRRLPVDERADTTPDNPYGAGKLMVEQALHWYHVCHEFDVLSLRYFNAAGAAADGSLGEESLDATNLVPKVMRALTEADSALPIYGIDYDTLDGTAVRDYVHVEDLAAAHVLSLELIARQRGEWVFNLGSGRGYSVYDVLAAARRASGRTVPHFVAERRPGDPPSVWADVTTAERQLGWRAEHDLDEIVRSAWLWQQRRESIK